MLHLPLWRLHHLNLRHRWRQIIFATILFHYPRIHYLRPRSPMFQLKITCFQKPWLHLQSSLLSLFWKPSLDLGIGWRRQSLFSVLLFMVGIYHLPLTPLLIFFLVASLVVADRKSSERSNRAITIALLMEFASRSLRRTPPASAELERTEYAKRDKDMLWYLLRGSIWDSYTRCVLFIHYHTLFLQVMIYRPKLESFVTRTAHTPLLGLFGALLKDWMPLIDDYYYCAHYSSSVSLLQILIEFLQTPLLSSIYVLLYLSLRFQPCILWCNTRQK